MPHRAYALVLAMFLSGCAATQQQIAQQQVAVAAEDHAFCQRIASGGQLSDQECRAMMADSRRNQAANQAAQQAATSQALLATSAAILSQNDRPMTVQPMPNLIPPQVRCRSTPGLGGTMQTVCQ